MAKIICPKCSSKRVKVISSKDSNYEFKDKWDVKMGTRVTLKKKKEIASFERKKECRCERCGNVFVNTENIKVK